MAKRTLWRWSTGKRGINRVTVFERRQGASLYIEWWDNEGRHQKALTTVVGNPVTDKELAKEIARDVSREMERIANNVSSNLWRGYQPGRTVGELLERYQEAHWDDWSEEHRKHQRRYREFWEQRLGPGSTLTSVTAAKVEGVVAKVGGKKGWATRTRRAYLMYIVAAFNFAEGKLKWISARHNLSAVDLPSPKKKTSKLAYTTDEAVKLLDALAEIDPRAAAVGEIALATGRRLNAIRTLPKTAYDPLDEGVAVLRFPADTDKAGEAGEAVIAGEAREAVEAVLDLPGPWLFPRESDPERPIAPEMLTTMLHDAEEMAGVEHVKGRAWHGFKRRFASIARNHGAAPHQAGTRRDTLEKRYEQDDLAPKVELARRLARERSEGDT